MYFALASEIIFSFTNIFGWDDTLLPTIFSVNFFAVLITFCPFFLKRGYCIIFLICANFANKAYLKALKEIVKIANIAAGIVVNKTGTSVAHLSEMLISANKNYYHLSKVMDLSEVYKVKNF